MLTHTSQTLIIVLIAILLPSTLSFPYSIYGMKNYRRASRATNNGPLMPTTQRQRYDQGDYRSPPSSPYYGNYDSMIESGGDNYYDDDSEDRPEREYLYGKPTYRGEYKPTRYYYARAPSYNNYNDRLDSTNPLDDLHEEMLQEEQHDRQRSFPAGKANWFQNTGQPKSLSNNFMKDLMLYNNGINVESQPAAASADLGNMYDDEDSGAASPPYFGDLSNQNEPYDYYDPLKFQSQSLNQFDRTSVNKPTYFNQDYRKQSDYNKPTKNHKQNDYDDQDSHEDKEEKDLESLRKNAWDKFDNEKQWVNDASISDKVKHEDTYNGGYDSGFDYDDDEWINWDRKRSLPKKPNDNLRPLKVLEFQLTEALHEQAGAAKVSSTMVPPTTSTTTSNSNAYEHKGQKEVVLSRPPNPLRRQFSDSVLDALTKTTNEMQQSNQDDKVKHDVTDDDKPQQHSSHESSTKKHKRFVSSEASLVKQLNDLKQKIKA